MDITIRYVLPTMLFLGASWLGLKEFSSYRSTVRGAKLRLIRRISGAVFLLIIAYMLHVGDISLILMDSEKVTAIAKENREYANACLRYWSTLMGLVLATVALAVWDTIDVLRRIRALVNASAQEDIKAFQDILEKSRRNQAAGKSKGKNNSPKVSPTPKKDETKQESSASNSADSAE